MSHVTERSREASGRRRPRGLLPGRARYSCGMSGHIICSCPYTPARNPQGVPKPQVRALVVDTPILEDDDVHDNKEGKDHAQ